MLKAKKRELEKRGWKTGSVDEFLGLSPEESAYIELKLSLSRSIRKLRTKQRLTQVDLANIMHSSQSRVAKIESGDPTVSLDLIIRSLLALGASRKTLARAIST